MKTKSAVPEVVSQETPTFENLYEGFTNAIKQEFDGLARFDELETEIQSLTVGTPEYRAAKKERAALIHQIRGSRKMQKDLKISIYKS